MQDDRRVVVIGSGPAGATAAAFLEKAGIAVTVLEAGREDDAFGLTARLNGITVAKRRRTLEARPNVRMTGADAEYWEDLSPGGLSNHWSCAVPRYSREDFADAREGGADQAWPITYEDLSPWYSQVEPVLHVAGGTADAPQVPAGKVSKVWNLDDQWTRISQEALGRGRSVVPMPYAYGADTTVTPSGTPFNAYVRLIRPAQKAGRIAVRFGARVLRLEWTKDKGRVESVVYRDARTGALESVACRAVVVAGGVVNTPQILLQSTSPEFPEGLGNTHGVLGAYLHDHPVGKLVVDLGSTISVHPPAYITRTLRSRSRPLYGAACMQWSGAEVLARSVLARTPGRMRDIGFSIFGTMAPSRENFVSVDRERKEKDGSGALSLHIHHPPEAEEALNEARDHVLELLGAAGLSPKERVWKIERPGGSNHYAGTCRMHASPEFGMLNSWGRLHAVRNVVVADCSAFTTGPEKNPVLTAMALAARASDRLARDLRAGDL